LEFEHSLGFDFCDLEFGYPMLETDFPVLNPNHNLNQMLDTGCLMRAIGCWLLVFGFLGFA
jgi:hypothetical protein